MALPHHDTNGNKLSTTAYIESIIHAYNSAINARRLTWDDPLYLATTDIENFRGTVRVPFEKDVGWREFRKRFELFVEKWPEYRTEILSISTEVDEVVGASTSFVNFEHNGQPPGVVRESVLVFRFWRSNGDEWRCVRIEFLDGLVPGSE